MRNERAKFEPRETLNPHTPSERSAEREYGCTNDCSASAVFPFNVYWRHGFGLRPICSKYYRFRVDFYCIISIYRPYSQIHMELMRWISQCICSVYDNSRPNTLNSRFFPKNNFGEKISVHTNCAHFSHFDFIEVSMCVAFSLHHLIVASANRFSHWVYFSGQRYNDYSVLLGFCHRSVFVVCSIPYGIRLHARNSTFGVCVWVDFGAATA